MQNADAPHIAVIGGGAAGLMAAGTALRAGARVTVYEHAKRTGTKLLITGKGRCNLTNQCPVPEFLENVVTNPRFLYAALSRLTPDDTMRLFEGWGVPLKTERGKRVFPVSDKSRDILDALRRYAGGAVFRFENVRGVSRGQDGLFTVTANEPKTYDRVILATGGRSYPLTGSDGSGYALARALGHTVTPLIPSLVPLVSPDPVCREMQGLSLRNVGLTIRAGSGKILYRDFGEMLFTHFGISGPMVLSASCHLHGADFAGMCAVIDLKPALDEPTLDARLRSDFASGANRDFSNLLPGLLPQKMIAPFIRRVGIPAAKKAHDITRGERAAILHLLKHFEISLSGTRPIEEAIVTSGGVNVREIDPKTMQSKQVPGLYFSGEILDVDAYTGGFNLQIAFSTGYVAGSCAAGSANSI